MKRNFNKHIHLKVLLKIMDFFKLGFSGGVQMVTIQKCKRHGVCNDCGKQQSEETGIWEIRASVTGQGWSTLMLCKECMMSLHTAMAIAVTQQ